MKTEKTMLTGLLERIEQLETRVAELESKLATKTVRQRATGRGRGRPSTIDEQTVFAVKDLLKKCFSVRYILEKLHMSRSKFYAIKAIIDSSDNSVKEKENIQNVDKLIAEIKSNVFGGQRMPTAKTWSADWRKVADFLTVSWRAEQLTSNEANRIVIEFFGNFLHPQSNKRHAKLLGNLLVSFQK